MTTLETPHKETTVLSSERKVVMAKKVARKYLESLGNPEYRVTVYSSFDSIKNLPSLMRSFRDGKIRMSGLDLEPIRDLGIHEEFDSMTVWSSNESAMRVLCAWLDSRGHENTGIF